MTKTQYFAAMTLDGYIAGADGSLDWLATRKRDEDGPMNYSAFIDKVGAMAMGATSYEWILTHEFAGQDPGDWVWPYDVPCWVFTHRGLPAVVGADIRFTEDDVATVHPAMVAAAQGRNVWILGGGNLASQFADTGLLDEVIVKIAPVVLGGGAALLPRHVELRLDEVDRNVDFSGARFSVLHK